MRTPEAKNLLLPGNSSVLERETLVMGRVVKNYNNVKYSSVHVLCIRLTRNLRTKAKRYPLSTKDKPSTMLYIAC